MKTLGTIIVFVLLSGATAYFAAKSVTLEKQLTKRTPTQSTESVSPIPTDEPTASPSPLPTVATSSPTPSATGTVSVDLPDKLNDDDRIVAFAQTHTVAEGDTLFPIGVQYNVNWERIAEANALKDPYPLSIGQTLIIPKVDAGAVVVEYTLDTDRATRAQSQVTAGQTKWRTDPVTTAQLELRGAYGIIGSDAFEEIAQDRTSGKASVRVTHLTDGQTEEFIVELSQPLTKGADGIWAPTFLRPSKS